MKAWSQPEMEELNVRATAYSPKGGLIEDGVYQSDDGKYTIPTYGPSSGNSGKLPGLRLTNTETYGKRPANNLLKYRPYLWCKVFTALGVPDRSDQVSIRSHLFPSFGMPNGTVYI